MIFTPFNGVFYDFGGSCIVFTECSAVSEYEVQIIFAQEHCV